MSALSTTYGDLVSGRDDIVRYRLVSSDGPHAGEVAASFATRDDAEHCDVLAGYEVRKVTLTPTTPAPWGGRLDRSGNPQVRYCSTCDSAYRYPDPCQCRSENPECLEDLGLVSDPWDGDWGHLTDAQADELVGDDCPCTGCQPPTLTTPYEVEVRYDEVRPGDVVLSTTYPQVPVLDVSSVTWTTGGMVRIAGVNAHGDRDWFGIDGHLTTTVRRVTL